MRDWNSDVCSSDLSSDENGNYSYIDSIQEAKRVFGEDLCATMRTVADDVKLQVEFNPAYVKGYRLIGYENRSLNAEDFKNDKVDAGEVGSGHAVTVAYEIVTADSPMQLPEIDSKYGGGERKGEKNGEWMTLSVRYKNPGENDSKQLSYGIGEADVTDRPSDNWKFASAVIEFGMLATKSEHAGTASFDGAIALMEIAKNVRASVINAGDGTNEHPTQALLDMFSIREKFGGLKGLRIAIVGDVTHSRVARSNIYGLSKMGASVTVAGPPTLMPPEIESLGCTATDKVDDAIRGADVVMGLRIQLERQKKGLFPSVREYHKYFGLTEERILLRSEERRVGKECRSRWSPYH